MKISFHSNLNIRFANSDSTKAIFGGYLPFFFFLPRSLPYRSSKRKASVLWKDNKHAWIFVAQSKVCRFVDCFVTRSTLFVIKHLSGSSWSLRSLAPPAVWVPLFARAARGMLVHLHTLLLQHKGQHTSTHIHTHTCTHTRAHTHMHIHMHIHTHRRTEEVTDRSCCEIFAGKIYFSLVIFLAHADCFLV